MPTSTSAGARDDPARAPRDADSAPSPALAPPPGNPRFPLFDGLRGFAVLSVLAFHVSLLTGRVGFGPLGRAAEVLGSVGPTSFFVISGFLLYRPYVAARARGRPVPSTRRYARRRALRVVPGYWTALTVLAVFPGLVGPFSGDWWRYYGYLQVYSSHARGLGIPVAWTLCVEVSFYVVLPLWAYAARRIAPADGTSGLLRAELVPLALVGAAGVAIQIAVTQQRIPYVLGVSLAGQCSWIIIGMALAVASVCAQQDHKAVRALPLAAGWPELCWAVAGASFVGLTLLVPKGGLLGLLAAIERPQSLPGACGKIVLQSVLLVALMLPAIFSGRREGLPRRVLALRPLTWLGVVSYSFYLYHLTIAELIAEPRTPSSFSDPGLNLLAHLNVSHSLVLYVLTLAVTGIVAAVSYRFVELPFLRRKESKLTR